ncbi:MAG TPA: alpha-1,2-fucosyltransferase [Chitinophagaceae bacterium]|nr:alpha-1,2-fucosyltransferase [Chitinophagaceae bacterium]
MVTSLSIGTGGLGRFGNQLFTIAGTIGIARKNGMGFGFPRWKNYDNALFGGEVTDFKEHFVNPLPAIPDGRQWQEYPYFWGYKDVVLNGGDWNIHAHLQSPKFFEHCMDEVRHYFRMKDEPSMQDVVCVHYRAGDYQTGDKAYHPRQTKSYYKEAMKHFPNEMFLVFSDDLDEAEEIIEGKNVHYFEGEDYLMDFAFMKQCKHFIIANSSFSAMAALLGEHPEKKVVAPSKWFGNFVALETKDIYHKDWLIIKI